jgi:hypothetical protein
LKMAGPIEDYWVRTVLIVGLQFLQHHETRPTWDGTVSGTVLPHESTWFPT